MSSTAFIPVALFAGALALGCERSNPIAPSPVSGINEPEEVTLEVAIAGPSFIATKGTYQFTAVGSGTASLRWSERFCDDAGHTSCTPWTAAVSGGGTYTRLLSHDCSVQEKNFQLQVVASFASQSATASHTVQLCARL
jgi:hypothetical protein